MTRMTRTPISLRFSGTLNRDVISNLLNAARVKSTERLGDFYVGTKTLKPVLLRLVDLKLIIAFDEASNVEHLQSFHGSEDFAEAATGS